MMKFYLVRRAVFSCWSCFLVVLNCLSVAMLFPFIRISKSVTQSSPLLKENRIYKNCTFLKEGGYQLKAFFQSSRWYYYWDDKDNLLLRRELPEDYGRMTIRQSGLVWLWVVYNSLAIPAVVIEMGGIHRWHTVRGMLKHPIAQIFLSLYVV